MSDFGRLRLKAGKLLGRVRRCEHWHSGPLVADQVEGGRVVSCLMCGAVGPVRKTSEEARWALQHTSAS